MSNSRILAMVLGAVCLPLVACGSNREEQESSQQSNLIDDGWIYSDYESETGGVYACESNHVVRLREVDATDGERLITVSDREADCEKCTPTSWGARCWHY